MKAKTVVERNAWYQKLFNTAPLDVKQEDTFGFSLIFAELIPLPKKNRTKQTEYFP